MMPRTPISGKQELEDLEIGLLLEGIWRRYGCDLRGYDRNFIRRQVQGRLRKERLRTPSQLLDRMLREPTALEAFVESGARSPGLFKPVRAWRMLRRKVMPFLRTYPSVRAWVAGCIPDSDLYSVLVLFEEELLRGYTVYGTDSLERAVEDARSGVSLEGYLREPSRMYQEAGGRKSLSDYFRKTGGTTVILPSLRERLVFATHDFASDASFNDFQLIVARNALRGFSASLRSRSLEVIHESLVPFGFLMLEEGESLEGSTYSASYSRVDAAAGLFQKTGGVTPRVDPVA